MRWFDLYLGLLAAMMGLGAAIAWTAGASGYAIVAFLVIGVAFLAAMAYRASTAETVLLVGPQRDVAIDALERELDRAGFAVATCEGPSERPCPVFHGQPCPIRATLSATMVWSPSGYDGPAPPCGFVFGVPTVTMHQGLESEPWRSNGDAHVGSTHGAVEAVHTLTDLVH